MNTTAVACGMVVLLTTSLLRAQPIPNAGPDAYTEQAFADDQREFAHWAMVEAYRLYGKRDPAWDAAAVVYLEQAALRLANGMIYSRRHYAAVKPWKWFRDQGEALVEAGCDDPLVRRWYGWALTFTGDRDGFVREARLAWELISQHDYPVFQRAYVLRGYQASLRWNTPESEALEPLYQKLRSESLLNRETAGKQKRAILAFYKGVTSDAMVKRFAEDAQAMADPDPWAYHLIMGRRHIDLAWEARGDGWAHEVMPEGWMGFADHLEKARQHLTSAYALDPSLPEPAAEMITVTTAGHGEAGLTSRDWFTRAVRAQFDFRPAYTKIRWSLQPRWGGSLDQMLAFGLACLDTQRYDTGVPWQFRHVLEDIRDDTRGDLSIYRHPEVWPGLQRMLNGMMADPLRARDRVYLEAVSTAYAWRAGDFAYARRLLDVPDVDRSSRKAWGFVDAAPLEGVSQVYARTGPAAEAFARADAAFEQRLYAAAEPLYAEARQAARGDGWSEHYGLDQMQKCRWGQRLDRPQAFSLLPDADLVDPNEPTRLVGWSIQSGQWRIEGDSILGEADAHGLEARLVIPMGNHWEMTAEIAMDPDDLNQALNAGFLLQHVHPGSSFQALLYPNRDLLRYPYNWKAGYLREVRVEPRAALRSQRWESVVNSFVDGQETGGIRRLGRASDDTPVGLGSLKPKVGQTARFHQPEFKTLQLAPDWVLLEQEQAPDPDLRDNDESQHPAPTAI